MSAEPLAIHAVDQTRRRTPNLYHTDWLVLRELGAAVERTLAALVKPGNRVLDFGCGDQPYRDAFEARGAAYLGADFGTHSDLDIRSDGSLDAGDQSVDIVASFQVLEHVRDLKRYLDEAARVLRPEGELVLSTHGTWLFHPHPEDHRRWTRMGLIGELEAHGWTVTHCESLVGPLAFTTLIRLTGFSFVLRKMPLFGRMFAGVLAVVMNLRAVIEDAITPAAIRDDNACVYLVRANRNGCGQ